MRTRTRSFPRLAGLLVAGALAGSGAVAQDLLHKAPRQSHPILIENISVHPVSGPTIERGGVFLDQGRIVAVWSGDTPRERGSAPNVERIDGRGLHVYPGLVSAYTAMGLTEIGAVRATNDHSEVGGVSPEVRAAVAVNPDSTIIPVTRRAGILTAAVFPQGGVVPGRMSVIRMDGWTWEEMSVEPAAGVVVNWPAMRSGGGRFARRAADPEEQEKQRRLALTNLREAFAGARAYIAARAADPSIPTDVRWEALRDALSGSRPVYITAQELEQIQSAVSWAAEEGLRCVIVGGRDAPRCADLLKRHDVTVIVTGTLRMPRRDDSAYDEAFALPSALEAVGVKWCLASAGGGFNTPHERSLPQNAGMAAAFGLSREAALRSITLSAAEALGVADRLGSLEAGKSATLFVSTGDPLEITSDVTMAFIDGRRIDLRSKQTELAEKYREKYRQLDAAPAPTGSSGGGGGRR